MTDRIPPMYCPEMKDDLTLLEKMIKEEEAVSVTYVGTIESGADYRDLYVVLTPTRMLHIVAIRRVCPNEKILQETSYAKQ